MILTATRTEISPVFTWTVIIGCIMLFRLLRAIFKEDPEAFDYKQHTDPEIKTSFWKEVNTYGSFSGSYVKTPLLTKREWKQYYVLKEIADSKNLIICPKVRLLDLIVPRPGIRNAQGLRSRVMSKHVDFVVCSYDMEVQAIIELDDNTHLRADRIKRDHFVDSVLTGAGYRVIHTWAITSDILDFIN